MPDRIGVDAEVAAATGQPSGAEREHLGLRFVDVGDADVEVELLRPVGVGPVGRLQVRRLLEGNPLAGAGDDDPVVAR